MKDQEPFIIAGPCAAESREQMLLSAQEALKRDIEAVRLSLWKPRTKPGFKGIGDKGIPVLLEVAQMGVQPATEIMLPQHANRIMEGVLAKDSTARVILWLGARNQNDLIQHDIGKIIAGEPRVTLMIKNPMWPDKNHWRGIVEHVLSAGASPSQLLLCHRGFAPSSREFRNPPDLNMALSLKYDLQAEFGFPVPLLIDPSHISGEPPERVIETAIELITQADGLIIEVHPNPPAALTDQNQQLNWHQFDEMLRKIAEVAKSGAKSTQTYYNAI